ncbi:MAG: L-aspartate oxidase [Oligoflexia bacterium]|nr:L-aspartate oxidase [Oligoflexia bacterium]
MQKFDFLVIGGGVAGLTYALEVASHGTVAVLFKRDLEDSSTSWAQGGVAAVATEKDSFELHIQDTLVAGAGICSQDTVRMVVEEGPARIADLIRFGAEFDRRDKGDYHLHQEGGHSRRRIYHAADASGRVIQRSLLNACLNHSNIKFITNAIAIDLITTHKLGMQRKEQNCVLGAYVMHAGRIDSYVAKRVLVATGGAGKVYLYTSNPDIATGDGIAMCYRAGVAVANLEFFQFHPTCLYHPDARTFLITEAMRGEGGTLRRINGERFMHKYHKDEELAPRDTVARAIDLELKKHGEDYVLLDISHRGAVFVKEHFPTIYERCLKYGFDITTRPIPVVPAAHYCCGGVVTGLWGETSVRNLYAAGEVAHTGLHGANRLASNSILEGLVFGYRAARRSLDGFKEGSLWQSVPGWDPGSAVDADEQVVISHNWDEIRRFMWNYVGIVRSNKRLERAYNRNRNILEEIRDYYWNFKLTPDLIELRNLSLVADLVIRCAMARHESRGLHYNIDFPLTRESWAKDTVLRPETSGAH